MELILPGFNSVQQAYLLYVEASSSCKASQYHVSAELHVPWAKNNEYYHFFTHLKRSPMKLRLYKSNPNVTQGMDPSEYVKVTLLLDPQCTFTISISSSWYHRVAQLARNYTPVLISYIAAVLLLVARTNILSLKENGKCMTIHGALMSDGVKPYYVLVAARLGFMVITSVPLLTYIFENASWANTELILFSRSLLVVPAYMTALGILHVTAAAILAVMVFSSQLAHRLFFRIVWRGGTSMAEKLASGLQKMPYIVIVVLVAGVPLSCGAASLVAGAAFYSFIVSKRLLDSGLQKMPYIVIVVLVAGVPLSCGAASLVAGAAFYSFIVSKRLLDSGLQKMPYIVIVVLVAGVPLSCGAASLVAGAAFYSFIVSKRLLDSGLQKMPYIVIVVLVAGVPLSCGAASLVAGAAFYSFIVSKRLLDSGLQKMPYIVIVVLVAGVPLSCGAASLVAGAAFYSFIVSKRLLDSGLQKMPYIVIVVLVAGVPLSCRAA
ncbi:hypothetical protein O0L34_g4777 [Tuta absoluta]|nr:hypothetical protein O0L34_g4777 [Tuta absoluta]KAJ2945872.1 hypothetical protein O0L34_g4777 [Tuta absoluta]KAJ2945873.1 hypothetical protein O0L34_g4777 [Tuta absoluta]